MEWNPNYGFYSKSDFKIEWTENSNGFYTIKLIDYYDEELILHRTEQVNEDLIYEEKIYKNGSVIKNGIQINEF